MQNNLLLFSVITIWLGLVSSHTVQDKWQNPQAGWLYVLDADVGSDENHVLLVDPIKGSIEGTITLGAQPELAVSHDGLRLFVMSGPAERGRITIYDARNGRAISGLDVQQRTLLTTPPQPSTMAVSRDNHWLFVPTMDTRSPGFDEYGISRFDVKGDSIIPAGRALLPECGVAQIIPEIDGEWDLLVHCPLGNMTRRILFDSDGHVAKYADLDLPSRKYDPAYGQMAQHPLATQVVIYKGAGDDISVLTGNNELCFLSMQDKTGPCSSFGAKLQGRWIQQRPGLLSDDGRQIYFGTGSARERSQGVANAVEVVDTSTMSISSIGTTTPFWTLALDPRHGFLYAASPRNHKIVQIDLAKKEETKEISMVNYRPAIIVPVF